MTQQILRPKYTKTYRMPTTVYFGRGILAQQIRSFRIQKDTHAVLVLGNHVQVQPWFTAFRKQVQQQLFVDTFLQKIFIADFATVDAVTAYCREKNPQLVIGIGGGTILDVAKSAAILARHSGSIRDYVQGKKVFVRHGIPFIAIPTTAGTGSEVTPWATIWGTDKKKYSLASEQFMFPQKALVNPALTDTLSPYVTATTGMDALTQAIESYWNTHHNSISDKYALTAIKIILTHVERAVKKGTFIDRDAMSWASLQGGLAFSNTQTTICHAISYPLTAHWGIAHGQAVSLTLPSFIERIVPILTPARKAKLLIAFGAQVVEQAAANIRLLMQRIGLQTTFSGLEIPRNRLATIAQESFSTNRIGNTPIAYSVEEIQEIMGEIY